MLPLTRHTTAIQRSITQMHTLSNFDRCSGEVCFGGILRLLRRQSLITVARDTTLDDTPGINYLSSVQQLKDFSVPAFLAQVIPPDESATPSARR